MFEGIVEVCLNGVWGTIISSGWNTPDAEVVCRQLGLSWGCESYDHNLTHFNYFLNLYQNLYLISFSSLLALIASVERAYFVEYF